MKKTGLAVFLGVVFVSAATSAAFLPAAAAEKPKSLDIGVFTFMSGPGAAYGVPGENGAKVLIDQINATGGIDGVPIKATYVDEAQGTQSVVTQFRRLSSDKNYDAMIAALSSANCLALAPVAEELKMPMVPWNCDTDQLFQHDVYQYVDRANTSVIPEFMAYVLYLAQTDPGAKRVAVIGPDYAMGHDADTITVAALKKFMPHARVVAQLYPKLGAPTYLTEISRLIAARPDVIFVNLWGADLTTFVHQALTRGLFTNRRIALTLGNTILQSMGNDLPDGVIVGQFGDGYWLSPTTQADPAAVKFIDEYHTRFNEFPTFPAFKMTNAILALQAAYKKAIATNNGAWPDKKQVTDALAGLDVKTFNGKLEIRKADHDGVVDQVVGVTVSTDKYPFRVLGKMARYPGEKVTPPAADRADPLAWISALPADFVSQLPKPGSY